MCKLHKHRVFYFELAQKTKRLPKLALIPKDLLKIQLPIGKLENNFLLPVQQNGQLGQLWQWISKPLCLTRESEVIIRLLWSVMFVWRQILRLTALGLIYACYCNHQWFVICNYQQTFQTTLIQSGHHVTTNLQQTRNSWQFCWVQTMVKSKVHWMSRLT